MKTRSFLLMYGLLLYVLSINAQSTLSNNEAWNIEGEFCVNGIWSGVLDYVKENEGQNLEFFGSYCNGDISTGSIASPVFRCKGSITLHLIGSYSRDGISISLRRLNGGDVFKLELPDINEWTVHTFDLPFDFIGSNVQLIASDYDMTHGGWLGFSIPFVINYKEKDEVLSREWKSKSSFNELCIWEGSTDFPIYLKNFKSIDIVGTYCNGDSDIGIVASSVFKCPEYLKLYLVGHFARNELNIFLEDVNTKEIFDLKVGDLSTWSTKTWKIDKNWHDRNVSLLLEDKDSTWGGWLAVSSPIVGFEKDYNGFFDFSIYVIENELRFIQGMSMILFFLLLSFSLYDYVPLVRRFADGIIGSYRFRVSDSAYLILGFLFLFITRLPRLMIDWELNPDESAMIAQAMRLNSHPLFWQDVDGTSGGPLLSYILVFLKNLLGIPYGYFIARLSGVILIFFTISYIFRGFLNLYGPCISRLVTLLLLTVYAFSSSLDFVHYSSEHVPLLLIGVLVWIFSKSKDMSKLNWHYFAAGIIIGISPFAKLQCIPIVFTLFIGLLYKSRFFIRNCYYLILGGLIVLISFLVYLSLTDLWADFYQLYIDSNIHYDNNTNYLDRVLSWFSYFLNDKESPLDLFIFILLFPFWLFLFCVRLIRKKVDYMVIFYFVLLGVSVLSILKTGNVFPHYLHFIVIPCALIFAEGLFFLSNMNYTYVLGEIKITDIIKYCFVLLLLCSIIQDFGSFNFNEGEFVKSRYALSENYHYTNKEIDIISSINSEYDPMAVWGWRASLFVETLTIPFGRDSNTNYATGTFLNTPKYILEFYRNSFRNEIIRNPPKLFIDGTGPGNFMYTTKAYNHNLVDPILGKYIKENYIFLGDFEKSRIYYLKKK